jgi:1-phosphofructokinase
MRYCPDFSQVSRAEVSDRGRWCISVGGSGYRTVVRDDDRGAARIMVFAPVPELTVTIEDRGGVPDLHLHAGSQGVWQAMMITSLGVRVHLVVVLDDETGAVLRGLLGDSELSLCAHDATARNGGYVHDRRSGERIELAYAPSEPLSRHDLDSLYETALIQGLEAGVAVLSGPTVQSTIPAQMYRRLTADLTANGCRVFADLSGDLLDAALAGGLTFLKVSHEELLDEGRAQGEEPEQLIAAMRERRGRGDRAGVPGRRAGTGLAARRTIRGACTAAAAGRYPWLRRFDDGRGGSLSRHRQLLGGGGEDGCRSRSAERNPARARHRLRG